MTTPIVKETKGDIFEGYKFSGGELVIETKKKFLNCMLLDSVVGIASLACEVSGIGKAYIYRLREEDAEFDRAWKFTRSAVKQVKADLFEASLVQLAKALNVTAVVFGLKKYNPDEFGDKGVDKPSDPVQHSLSPEYAAMLNRLLKKNGENKTKS